MSNTISLFLSGDVMLGRGIDQILPHPSPPALYEESIRDARDYVRLAEQTNGPIPRAVSGQYIWGDALAELNRTRPDVRIINLETSITRSDTPWPGKGIHYRMHPANISSLTAAQIDCCVLANNHVLDWGYPGLDETIRTLDAAGIHHAGAGADWTQAAHPAVIDIKGGGRVLVFSAGTIDSGIPWKWRAEQDRPGLCLLPDLSPQQADAFIQRMNLFRRPGDIVVASLHWGGNWGYEIPPDQVSFAHRLLDAGIDLLHGHSSHHIKQLEIYRQKLILYGCGDFLTDYEGIPGHEQYHPGLTLLYLAHLNTPTGTLATLQLIPLRLHHFRLHQAPTQTQWLKQTLPPQTPSLQITENKTQISLTTTPPHPYTPLSS